MRCSVRAACRTAPMGDEAVSHRAERVRDTTGAAPPGTECNASSLLARRPFRRRSAMTVSAVEPGARQVGLRHGKLTGAQSSGMAVSGERPADPAESLTAGKCDCRASRPGAGCACPTIEKSWIVSRMGPSAKRDRPIGVSPRLVRAQGAGFANAPPPCIAVRRTRPAAWRQTTAACRSPAPRGKRSEASEQRAEGDQQDQREDRDHHGDHRDVAISLAVR